MGFFKILTFMWPFVKEMLLEDKTVIEAFKTNKKKVLLAAVVMLSFAINAFVIPRLITISKNHVILQREHEKLVAVMSELKSVDQLNGRKPTAPIEDPPRRVAETAPEAQPNAQKKPEPNKHPNDDRVAKARKMLDAIRHQEEQRD